MQPFDRMNEFNKKNPEAKDVYKKMQQWHLKNKPDNGMFCPSSEISLMSQSLLNKIAVKKMVIKSNLGKLPENEADDMCELVDYFWSLSVFGTWRNTLGVYSIDPDVLQQIIKSPIPDDTPTSIFSRLPEWCVYVKLLSDEDLAYVNDGEPSLLGFWASIDTEFFDNKKKDVLNLFFNIHPITPDRGMQALQILLEDGVTVAQAVRKKYHVAPRLKLGIDGEDETIDIKIVTKLLSLLLWLCAEEPDITNIAGEPVSGTELRQPKYRRNKKTGAFIPPNQPITYTLGKRLGGEVRAFNEKYGKPDARISSRKRPHIRRGHWHGVWRGTGQNKSFHVYWQPAVFVNATI